MRSCITCIIICLIITAAGLSLEAQETKDLSADKKTQLPSVEERKNRLANIDLAMPEIPDDIIAVPETNKVVQETLRSYYEYRKVGYAHRIKVFEWQYFSSKIIFCVVILLMFSGIYFAAVQFHAGLKNKTKEADEASEFVFSLKGIKVKSPVLGLIVLTISLAFFYLYLVHVYPIVNVF